MTARTVRATPAQVRAAAVPPPPAPVVEAVPPPAAPARKVRRTVDLTAAQHRDLNRFLDEAAEVARVVAGQQSGSAGHPRGSSAGR
jgi:hypothetical protein